MIYLQANSTPFSLPDFEAMWETLASLGSVWILIGVGLMASLLIGGITLAGGNYKLSSIKSVTVGDGQHGTARWATSAEMKKAFSYVPFAVKSWRKGEQRPEKQGLVLGCVGSRKKLKALVDSDDIHCLMIGASGVGKTAFFLYPNLEYACASGWKAVASFSIC